MRKLTVRDLLGTLIVAAVVMVPMLAGLVIMWILALMHDAGYAPRGHTAAHA